MQESTQLLTQKKMDQGLANNFYSLHTGLYFINILDLSKESSPTCMISPVRQNNQLTSVSQLPGDSRQLAASQMAVLAEMAAHFLLSALLKAP